MAGSRRHISDLRSHSFLLLLAFLYSDKGRYALKAVQASVCFDVIKMRSVTHGVGRLGLTTL